LGYSEGTVLLAVVTNARTVRAGRVADCEMKASGLSTEGGFGRRARNVSLHNPGVCFLDVISLESYFPYKLLVQCCCLAYPMG